VGIQSKSTGQSVSIDPSHSSGIIIREACANVSFQYVANNIPQNWQYVSHEWSGAEWAQRPIGVTSSCPGSKGSVNAPAWNVTWTDYYTTEVDAVHLKLNYITPDGPAELKATRNIRIRRIGDFRILGPSSIQRCCTLPQNFQAIGFADGIGDSGYSYSWSFPLGWTVDGANNQSIITLIPDESSTGEVSLTITRPTGVSKTVVHVIDRFTPSFAINTTSGPLNVCPNEEITLHASSPDCGTPIINWSLPMGWIILSGQGTPTITITPTIQAQDGNVTISGFIQEGGCFVNQSSRALRYINEIPPSPDFLVLGTTDLPHINWINQRWHVCPNGLSTVIEVIPSQLDQSYIFTVNSPWQINGQSNPIVTTNPFVFVSSPSNAPFSGVLTAQAINCIGSSEPNSYRFLRNDGPIPCGEGGGGVKALKFYDELEIYPNPANDYIIINVGFESIHDFKIISMSGQVMDSYQLLNKNERQNIDISTWPSGFYILEYKTEQNNMNYLKLIKQ